MKKENSIPYGHQSISAADIRAVTAVLRSDFLTQGPAVEAFERALARRVSAKYAVAFSSGTAALHGAFFAAGLKAGDEFLTSPLTFAATANAGRYLGARPVFADIDARGNLDPNEAAKKIRKAVKALVVVDYAGTPADLNAFRRLAKRHKLVLIEDACHALGATYKGRSVGSVSDLTVFSFHPVKSITTGEGGAVVTDNPDYYLKLCAFRTHGIVKDNLTHKTALDGAWYHEMQSLGFNYRMNDMEAALGLSQLRKLDSFLSARRRIAARYARGLNHLKDRLELPEREREDATSALHLYVVRIKGGAKERLQVFNSMRQVGIGVQVHYLPVYLHPYYRALGYRTGLCPRAEHWYEECLSLPLFPGLRAEDQKKVIDALSRIL